MAFQEGLGASSSSGRASLGSTLGGKSHPQGDGPSLAPVTRALQRRLQTTAQDVHRTPALFDFVLDGFFASQNSVADDLLLLLDEVAQSWQDEFEPADWAVVSIGA